MNAASNSKNAARFTGRHMLSIMLAFFGTIIGVNCLMAYYASASWSGILAKNTYVASQEFNIKAAEARNWAAEGFRGQLNLDGNALRYHLEGPNELIDGLGSVTAFIHRPVGDHQDLSITLPRRADGTFEGTHTLMAGQWIVDIAAIEDGRTIFHQASRIVVPEDRQ